MTGNAVAPASASNSEAKGLFYDAVAGVGRHCEERSDEAIQIFRKFAGRGLDCFASLAMTEG